MAARLTYFHQSVIFRLSTLKFNTSYIEYKKLYFASKLK
jgi:hypothetical protein